MNIDDAKRAWSEEAFEDGWASGIELVAMNMLKRGKSFEDIQADTNFPLDRICDIANNLKKQTCVTDRR